MELPGEIYLYNLSLIAVTFTAVSALVMLVRQSMGGAISKFDIHLITTYLSYGFSLSLIALLPPLIFLFELSTPLLWTISSVLAALIFSPVLASVILRRRKSSPLPAPFVVKTSFGLHGIAILIFLLNAFVWPWQGVHLYATAATLSIATVMWMFVRRIASLFGDKTLDGFDPTRG